MKNISKIIITKNNKIINFNIFKIDLICGLFLIGKKYLKLYKFNKNNYNNKKLNLDIIILLFGCETIFKN